MTILTEPIGSIPRPPGGPFRYERYADSHLTMAMGLANKPVKQAVISPSVLSLMYPPEEIPGYPREQFILDLLHEHETEVRNRLRLGACEVQIDTASAKIRARVLGTSLAAEEPGV